MNNKVAYWAQCRSVLKKIYQSRGITKCELNFEDCWVNDNLSFAHRHKRNWYLDQPELLGSFQETLLACVPCHQILEKDPELTKKMFNQLRDEERPTTMTFKKPEPKKKSKFKTCPKCKTQTTLFVCNHCGTLLTK
jgi:hypothetical protein